MIGAAGVTRRPLLWAAVRLGPSGYWLGLRLLVWRAALPLLKRVLPLSRVVALVWPRRCRSAGERDRTRELRIAAGIGLLFGGNGTRRRDNCLERSLLAYRFLAEAGGEPQLVWGVRRNKDKLEGHAWVVLDGDPLADPAEEVDSFTPITTFGRGGWPVPEPPGRPPVGETRGRRQHADAA